MKKLLMKYIFGVILFSTPSIINAQVNQDSGLIKGTYTIYVNSLKESNKTLTDDQLQEIDALREDTVDIKASIGDMNVLIMSREKMEADYRWPEYSILNK